MKFSKTLSAICLLLFAFCFLNPVDAFNIAPARQTVVMDPGTSGVVPIDVVNTEDRAITLTPEISPFTVESKTGLPIFDGMDEATDWIRAVPEQMLLEPGQSGTFSFAVSVPDNAEPESHYLGLFVRSLSESGQVGVSTRLGSLLFLHVAGETREELVRKEFSAEKSWYTEGPVELHLALENVGTIHVIPSGTITLFDMSNKEIAKIPVNESGRSVLPGGVYEENVSFDALTLTSMGRVRAKLDLTYGLTEKELHDSTTFWLVSWNVVIGGTGGIILLLILFILTQKRSRKKKEVTSTVVRKPASKKTKISKK